MKYLSTILVALLVVGSVAATGVLIRAQTREAGLNDAAYFAYGDGNHAAAERLYLAALEENPSYETARYNLATLYFEQGRFDDAIAQLEALVAEDPSNPRYHYDLAVNLVENIRQNERGFDQWGRAMDAYRTTLALDPSFPHAAENLAVMGLIAAEYGVE